jgi:GxxExxY protein
MDQQTYQIIGAAIEVHKELGRGFLEPVYQEALELEFNDRGIPFEPQREMSIFYKGRKLKTHYRSDFVCYDDVVVELKALTRLADAEVAQVLNYLKVSRRERALLINFGSRSLQHERLVWSVAAQAQGKES